MTEKAESSKVLANILRTTPYTAYLASFTVGLCWPDSQGLRLFCALVANELSNHALKAVVKKQLYPQSPWLTARPPGAKDCGIYPAHYPTESKSSGMPSGHSQTACFLATLLLQLGNPNAIGRMFVIGYTGMVLLSRTKYGGPYVSVSVDGKIPGCHTILQVVVGAIIGTVLGLWVGPWVFDLNQ